MAWGAQIKSPLCANTLPTARHDRFDDFDLHTQSQFGGISFGIGGLGIPAFGSTGFVQGGFGGVLGGPGAPIGPVITLEQAFGVGFTAEDIADQIRAAEQEGRLTPGGVIDIATGPIGRLVINLGLGLFEILDPTTGTKIGAGTTAEAAIEAVRSGGAGGRGRLPEFPPTLGTVTTPPFVAPQQPGFETPTAEGLRTLAAILAQIMRDREAPFDPAIHQLPPTFEPIRPQPLPPGPVPVRPGGTVNVPVVLGSTGDPTGVRRPRFPDQDQLSRAQQIGQIIFQLLQLRKARQNADKQRRAFEQFLAARLELLRRQQMPFGQSGTFLSAPNGGRDFLGGALGDFFDWLGRQFPGSPGDPTRLPFPGPPGGGAPPGMPQLPSGGGGCPPLFRGGMPMRMSPVPWFPVQAPNGRWYFFGHLGTPTFSKLKGRRRHHHHYRKR